MVLMVGEVGAQKYFGRMGGGACAAKALRPAERSKDAPLAILAKRKRRVMSIDRHTCNGTVETRRSHISAVKSDLSCMAMIEFDDGTSTAGK